MSSASFFVSPLDLWSRIGTADAPMVLDVCRREIYEAGPGVIPTAQWHKPETYMEWVPSLPTDRPIVLACRYGHNLSQMIAAELRARGVSAQVLEGGRKAWSEAGLPVVTKATLERFAPKSPSLWVTRRRPKIDRVACPWLIRRFIDRKRASIMSIQVRCSTSRTISVRSRSISRASRSAMRVTAARSTRCSSCSGWKATRISAASR